MAGLFLQDKRSAEREENLLRKFLLELEDIDAYLDEYDEFFGLAFNKHKPIECLEELRMFLAHRFVEVMGLSENMKG